MQAHQFTGVWRKWQKQYNPEDPRSRTKFLAANVARIEAKLAERAVTAGTLADQQQARATNTTATLSPIGATCGSDEDLESAQHEIAQADEQGVPVTLSQRHINNRSSADTEPMSFNVACCLCGLSLWCVAVAVKYNG